MKNLLALLLLLLTTEAGARSAIEPGAFFARDRPGVGILIDVDSRVAHVGDANSNVFGAFFGYGANGEPTFYTFGGELEFTGSLDPEQPDARLVSPLFRSTGGECFTCAFRPAVTLPDSSVGDITIEVYTPRLLEVKVGAKTWTMEAMEISRSFAQIPEGSWLMSIGDFIGSLAGPNEYEARVRTVPLQPMPYALDVPIAGDAGLPPATAVQYEVVCDHQCAEFDAWRRARTQLSGPPGGDPQRVVWWIDPVSKRSGIDLFVEEAGVRRVALIRQRFELGPAEQVIRGEPVRYRLDAGELVRYSGFWAGIRLTALD